jgi:hypothetical protein
MPSKHITQWIGTRHASRRLGQRHVSEEAIRAAILHPDSQRQQRTGEHDGIVWKFEKQYATRRLRVIAELQKETCYVITAFWIGE